MRKILFYKIIQRKASCLLGHLLAPVLALPPLVLLHRRLHQAVDRLAWLLLLGRILPTMALDLNLE